MLFISWNLNVQIGLLVIGKWCCNYIWSEECFDIMCHILSQRWKEMMLFKLNSQENRNRRKVFFRKPVKLTGFSWKLRLWPTNDLKWPQIFYLEAELVLGLILNILEFPLSTSMVSWNVSSVLVVVSLSLSWKRMFYPAFIPICGR